MWTRPGKRSCPPFHWLLCDFQGPRRGGARHVAARDIVQRAAGDEPVSQNSTAREVAIRATSLARNSVSNFSRGIAEKTASIQIRSTSLVAGKSSVHRRGELESSRGGRTRAT